MKIVYELTCYDCTTRAFISKFHYSNKKAAIASFKRLKKRIIAKFDLANPKIVQWTFKDGGLHRSDIINERYSVSLIPHSISKEPSIFIS